LDDLNEEKEVLEFRKREVTFLLSSLVASELKIGKNCDIDVVKFGSNKL
jgi:hypothetical protein